MPDFDSRDLAPKGRRTQPDRRQGPRREEERALHYAEQALIAAALEWSVYGDVEGALIEAVDRYRAAVKDLHRG